MKTCTSMDELLGQAKGGRIVVLPHEKVLEEIRTHHSEIFQGLKGLSLKIPRKGIHVTMVLIKDEGVFNSLKAVLEAKNVNYSFLGPKGKIISPEAAAA